MRETHTRHLGRNGRRFLVEDAHEIRHLAIESHGEPDERRETRHSQPDPDFIERIRTIFLDEESYTRCSHMAKHALNGSGLIYV